MNQKDFLEKWHSEVPIYEAWGQYIISKILESLEKQNINKETFLKIPTKERIKADQSILDKAFTRKSYEDPYNEIEDKVGVRFVVLLTEDVKKIVNILKNEPSWSAINARDYEQEKEDKPLLFAYQSMHYILRPITEIEYNGLKIPTNTPCEVQIRTLLQHAHAELTHDEMYKSQKKIKPSTHRIVAKCMALIETTDSFFCDATKELHNGSAIEYKIIERLDSLFLKNTGLEPYNEKSSLILFDTFENFITIDLIENIQKLVNDKPYIIDRIKEKYIIFQIYQQSVILFAYWLIEKKTNRVKEDWPLDRKVLQLLATDLSIALSD